MVVVCLGEDAYAEKPGDIDSLALPWGQRDFLSRLASLPQPNKPKVVLVLFEGRPRVLGAAVDEVDAVIHGELLCFLSCCVFFELLCLELLCFLSS